MHVINVLFKLLPLCLIFRFHRIHGSLVLSTSLTVFTCVVFSKQLKEPYTLDDLRDVFMRIRATLETNRSAWVQYVLPPDNVLPDDLASGSSSSGDASNSFTDMDSHDNAELDHLMKETRAVLAR